MARPNWRPYPLKGMMLLMSTNRPPSRLFIAVLMASFLAFSPVVQAQDSDEETEVRTGPSPWVAGILSLLMPGGGQFYVGERERALWVLGGAAVLVAGKILT